MDDHFYSIWEKPDIESLHVKIGSEAWPDFMLQDPVLHKIKKGVALCSKLFSRKSRSSISSESFSFACGDRFIIYSSIFQMKE